MNNRKNTNSTRLDKLARFSTFLVAPIALLFGAQNSLAQLIPDATTVADSGCMQDVAGFGLNCTANDIQIAGVTEYEINDDGCAEPGDTITFTAAFEVLLTAQARHDIGLWFATDGDLNGDGAYTGTCTVGTPAYQPDPPWLDLDGTNDTFLNTNVVSNIQDTCGDIDANHNHNPMFPVMTVTAQCIAGPDGDLSLPNCTSWKQPGDNDLCTSPLPIEDVGGAGLDSSGVPPGAPSKCRCDAGFTVPIPIPAFITVDKVTVDSDGNPLPGDPTLFDFSITGPDSDLPDGFSLSDAGGVHTSPPLDTKDQDDNAVGPYQVTEGPVPSGWEFVSASCTRDNATPGDNSDDVTFAYTNGDDIQPIGGEVIACTFTNQKNTGTLTLQKTVVNDNGGQAVADDFQAYMNTSMVDWGQTVEFNDGVVVTASEDLVDGYSAGDWGGDCAADGTVTIEQGVDKVCTITNDDISPTLTVIKTVINDAGGTASPDDFNLTVDGFAVLSGATNDFDAGAHTVAETLLAGYEAGDWGGDCAADGSITLALDQDATCTITNDDIAPTLTLIKTVVNDDGGQAVETDFQARIDGSAVPWNSVQTLSVGTFTASEDLAAGYEAGDWTGDCAADGTVSLALGEDKTCYITNDDIAPTLTLVKTVVNDDGGTLTESDFPAFIDGNAVAWGVAQTLTANATYTASETEQFGYLAGAWGGDCAADGTVELQPGDAKICTITNDDIAPTLTLIKTVTNDDGGTLGVGDFPLFISGSPTTSGTAVTLAAGDFLASETTQFGYAPGPWTGDCDAGGNVSLSVGENKTCTINNDDIAPTLTLIKTVINNDGGSLGVSDFPLFISGSPATSGVAVTLMAGGYVASETTQFGYAAGPWTGACDASGNVTLSVGQNLTCTITNDDIAPTLKLVKTVNNDDGGSGVATEWTLSATADAPRDGRNISQAGGTADFVAVFANAVYDLAEVSATWTDGVEYNFGSFTCDGGVFDAANQTIHLSQGQTGVTCTVVNDDIAPTLRLVKQVDNGSNPGGTAGPDNWTLLATAAAPDDGRNFSNLGGSGVFQTVFSNAGYDLSESTDPDYQVKTSWSCSGGSLSGSTVTLAEGETNVTCTIVNEALGEVEITKNTTFAGVPSNDLYQWNFGLYAGPNDGGGDSSFLGTPLATDSTSAGDNVLDFGVKLDPNQTYTVCELSLPAGWSAFWRIDTDNDFVADTIVTPYNPNESDDPPEDLGNRCYDFTVGIGSKLVFEIENNYPGGGPRTPGYWKNWNRVTDGGQAENSDRNGGWEQGFWLLEHVLDPNIGGGIYWDDILNDSFFLWISNAEVAVDILDQRDVADPNLVGDGDKHANDAAYTLAMHLLAAQLNFGAGAESCDAARDAALAGEELLDEYDFDGTGDYLLNNNRQTKKDYNKALELATQLDEYNNGELCSGPAVAIETPVDGLVLDDSSTPPLTIEASVLDLFGIAQVEFFVDGASIGVDTDIAGGWSASWDWTDASEGDHVVTAVATNTNAESGSADVTVTVDLVADVPIHVAYLGWSRTADKGGKWTATVTTAIVDSANANVEDATVTGVWLDGSVASCTTNALGVCDVSSNNNKNTVETSFTVTDVSHATFVYDPSANVANDTGTIPAP